MSMRAIDENVSHDGDNSCSTEQSAPPPPRVPEKKDDEALAKRETRFVRWMRLVVVSVLVVSTLSIALATYSYTSGNEREQFKENFYADANKVLAAIGDSIDLTLTAIDTVVVTTVSYAMSKNMSWPFVTLPNFEARCAKIRVLSKSIYLSLYVRVTRNQRKEWELYAKANNGWINESLKLQETDENYYGPILYDYYTVDEIHDYWDQPLPEKDLYYVTWQNSPAIPRFSPYNWDLLSWTDNVSLVALETRHRVVLSEAYHLPDPQDEKAVKANEIDIEWFKDYVKPGDNPGEPASDIYYPILDTVDRVKIKDPERYELRGTFAVTLLWSNMFKDVLPVGSDGVIVVFENECNPSFTYRIHGPNVIYVGRGDLHDRTYEKYGISSWLLDLNSFTSNQSNYAGVPVDHEFCPFKIHVYPSEEMEDDYVTKQPVILTICAVLIFLFTSAVFLLYDRVVEYRQRFVMKKAERSRAIVDSLFPPAVRDRLLTPQNSRRIGKKKPDVKDNPLASFISENFDFYEESEEEGAAEEELVGPPIADLFPHTTIFFADLAGFTKWSSTRTPIEVFELLESLYRAFDKIARKRSVFKVETIGDCYVAVTGIPFPQEKHAVIMVRFARQCMRKMDVLIHSKLAARLGDDTRELQMRVGLHSGPTTAGVLRGDRGRFQLFGDTVNTASRMESNGVPGRIHISQATADELIARGKGDWLEMRPDKIVAKGKGEMQTYFISSSYVAHSIGTASDSQASFDGNSSFASETEQGDDIFKVLPSDNLEASLKTIEQLLAKRNNQIMSGCPKNR